MTKEELLKQCRYYKGEDINPYNKAVTEGYDTMRAKAWYFEMLLCSNLNKETQPFSDSHYLEYTDAYAGFRIEDDLPLCLKDCVLMMFLHKNELPMPDEFQQFYKRWKSGGL